MVDDNPDMMAIRPDEDAVAAPSSEWRRHCRRLLTAGCVAAATMAGAALPLFLVDSGFRGYVSQARIEVTQTAYDAPDASRFSGNGTPHPAFALRLERVTADLKLTPADMVGVRNQGELGLLFDLLTGGQGRVVSPREALNGAVGEAIRLELTPDENTLVVTAKAATPETAMRLTDYLSMRVMADGKAGTMTPAMRIMENARKKLDEAEAAVNGFQMRHGDAVLTEVQQLEQQLRDVNEGLARSGREKQLVKADLTAVAALKPNDVFSKPLPTVRLFLHLRISGKSTRAPAWRLPPFLSTMVRNIPAASLPRTRWMPCRRLRLPHCGKCSTGCGRTRSASARRSPQILPGRRHILIV